MTSLFLAATIYVMAPNGVDTNPGTVAAPWATLAHANQILQPGDTLSIRGGVYAGQESITWIASGVPTLPITLQAYPNERPIFDGSMLTDAPDFLHVGPSFTGYLTISGLEVTGYTWEAFGIGYGSHVTIQDCYIHDMLAQSTGAVYVGGLDDGNASTILIKSNHFARIGRTPTNQSDHAIYVSQHAHGVTLVGNLFEQQRSGAAIHVYHADITGLVLQANTIHLMPDQTQWGICLCGPVDTAQIVGNVFVTDSGVLTVSPLNAVYVENQAAGEQVTLKSNQFSGPTPLSGWVVQEPLPKVSRRRD
jgi:hypothetical protein